MITESRTYDKHTRYIKNTRLFFCVLLFLAAVTYSFTVPAKVQAASASVQVKTKNITVTKGDTLYVIINVSSSEKIKGFDAFFAYDFRYLAFKSGGNVVHGNDDSFHILDIDRSEVTNTIKYSIKFKARKTGGTSITVKDRCKVFDEDGTKMSVSSSDLYMNIKDKIPSQEQISDTDSPQKSEVKHSETEPGITTSDEKVGSENRPDDKIGEAVGKESDDKSDEQMNSEDTQDDKKSKETGEAESGLYKKNSKLYLNENIKIRLLEAEDSVKIPEGFRKSEVTLYGENITAYILEKDDDRKVILLYGKGSGNKGFYLYDMDEKYLCPYEYVENWNYKLTQGINSAEIDRYEKQILSYRYLMGIMAVGCLLIIIVTLFIRRK